MWICHALCTRLISVDVHSTSARTNAAHTKIVGLDLNDAVPHVNLGCIEMLMHALPELSSQCFLSLYPIAVDFRYGKILWAYMNIYYR